VVAAFQVKRAVIGLDGRLRVVTILGRKEAVHARLDFPAGFLRLGRRRAGLLLRPRRRRRQRQQRRQDQVSGLHPPSAIVKATSAAPIATMTRPVSHGRNPEAFASFQPPQKRSTIAMALEIRSARIASGTKKKGSTTGKVERKTSRNVASAPRR